MVFPHSKASAKKPDRSPNSRASASARRGWKASVQGRNRRRTETTTTWPDSACDKCRHPLTRIDFYGELLEGCIYCNVWKEVDRGVWRKIPRKTLKLCKGCGA